MKGSGGRFRVSTYSNVLLSGGLISNTSLFAVCVIILVLLHETEVIQDLRDNVTNIFISKCNNILVHIICVVFSSK